MKRPDQRDRLAPQDCLYTALQRDGTTTIARILGCVRAAIVAPEDPAGLITRLADSACRIVSLTVTEKGYCHDPASGRLDANHPDIFHDLAHPTTPRSAVGLIVAALTQRHDAGQPPFTVLCCDNQPHNGSLVGGLVRDFAALRSDRLAAWIEATTAFPATMVDRIVPAATDADLADAMRLTGLSDAAPISHEPFRQWVIEDRFVDGVRPHWEKVGAELVTDVRPYEHMKLRLLNGAHSALAYLGYLAGHETIADTVADPMLRRYVTALWQEIIPVVPPPPGVDLANYTTRLLDSLRQSGDPPSHLADRHGWITETTPSVCSLRSANGWRTACQSPVLRSPSRMDSLCRRHRRGGPTYRCARSDRWRVGNRAGTRRIGSGPARANRAAATERFRHRPTALGAIRLCRDQLLYRAAGARRARHGRVLTNRRSRWNKAGVGSALMTW